MLMTGEYSHYGKKKKSTHVFHRSKDGTSQQLFDWVPKEFIWQMIRKKGTISKYP